MSTTNDGSEPKKRVKTRGRKPPEIVRPNGAPAPEKTERRPIAPGTMPKKGPPIFMGGARNEHGTRLSRRITCSRCGNADHVPYVPKDESRVLCRTCAAEVLHAYEKGTKVPTEMRPEVCNLCGTPFQIPTAVPDDGDPLCPNCLRGFTTWTGSIDTPWEERQSRVTLNTEKPSVVVRKKQT